MKNKKLLKAEETGAEKISAKETLKNALDIFDFSSGIAVNIENLDLYYGNFQ